MREGQNVSFPVPRPTGERDEDGCMTMRDRMRPGVLRRYAPPLCLIETRVPIEVGREGELSESVFVRHENDVID